MNTIKKIIVVLLSLFVISVPMLGYSVILRADTNVEQGDNVIPRETEFDKTFKYKNLEIGKTYYIEAKILDGGVNELLDKEGKPISVEAKFITKTAGDGAITLHFDLSNVEEIPFNYRVSAHIFNNNKKSIGYFEEVDQNTFSYDNDKETQDLKLLGMVVLGFVIIIGGGVITLDIGLKSIYN